MLQSFSSWPLSQQVPWPSHFRHQLGNMLKGPNELSVHFAKWIVGRSAQKGQLNWLSSKVRIVLSFRKTWQFFSRHTSSEEWSVWCVYTAYMCVCCNCTLSRINHSVSTWVTFSVLKHWIWPRYHTERSLKANLWLPTCERVYFFFFPACFSSLTLTCIWSFLESIQTQNKSIAALSEPLMHILMKDLAWMVHRVQEHAQCLSPCTLTAPRLCWYHQSLSRGAKARPRSDCSDSQQGRHIRSTGSTPCSHGPWL